MENNETKNITTIADLLGNLDLEGLSRRKPTSNKSEELTLEEFLAEYGDILLTRISDVNVYPSTNTGMIRFCVSIDKNKFYFGLKRPLDQITFLNGVFETIFRNNG